MYENCRLCTHFSFGKTQIAVIHAGWRGIAQEIVQNAVKMEQIDGAIMRSMYFATKL